MMTTDDVRRKLQAECDKLGSRNAWAKANGMSAVYVNQVIKGDREPGEKILVALGLERVLQYRRVQK